MSDPKMALTKFSEVYQLKREVVRGGGTARYSPLANELATSVRETDEAGLSALQQEYSISSVEEIVALADVARRTKTKLLKSLPLAPATVSGMVRAFQKSKEAMSELADWARYARFDYQLGCDIDLDTPPPEEPITLAMGTLGAAVGLGPAGAVNVAAAAFQPRTVSLIDQYMSPIRDQLNRGTCVAFASIACLEYHHHRFGGRSDLNLSEQHAYWAMVTKTGQHNLAAMLPLLRDTGVATERTWPYFGNVIQNDDAQGPPPPLAGIEAPAYKCMQVLQLPPRSIPDIRATIGAGHPVAVGIPVYPSWFESQVVRKYGNITVPLPGEVPNRIGHAIALVGYEDNADYAGGGFFIVRNSWDKNWATAGYLGPGYGTIPYRYIERFNWDAWYIAS